MGQTPRSTLESRFQRFHEHNPQVYCALRDLARAAQSRGERGNIALLTERLRSQVETTGDRYVLNNSYRAFYARLLMAREPSLQGFFAIRKEAVDVTYRRRGSSGAIAKRSDRSNRRDEARLF